MRRAADPAAMDDHAGQTGVAAHAPDSRLKHHFDTSTQQFEASKLGMWMFLATEVLLFGGLFCLYAIYRANHPEIFHYGSRYLDRTWGAINTVVLILSSFTMASAVWCAQCGRKRLLAFFLLLTLLFAGDFLLIKYIEYSHKIHEHLVWGTRFYEAPAGSAAAPKPPPAAPAAAAASGRDLWMATCRSCHGVAGEGITGQGKDIRGSTFIAEKTDAELLAFVKVGRMPFDPLNTTGIQMPPRGGNPLLTDRDLESIIGYLRTFTAPDAAAAGEVEGAQQAAEAEELWIPRSLIPPPPAGPAGLAAARLEEPLASVHHAHDPGRPDNAHMFFGVYFMMTGLHGLHVLVGMAIIAWLLVRTLKGHFTSRYYTPVDLGGLYWHIVDLIWIFLFPLLYLIS